MEHKQHKRDKALMIYWIVMGLGLGIIIAASTHEVALSLIGGIAMGAAMALVATKQGLD
jgi:hypothetical protein